MTAQAPGSLLDSDPLARVGQLAGVADAVVRARSGVDALLRHKMLRRRSAEVTAEASLRSARASAALDGHDVALDVLRRHLTAAAVDGGDSGGGGGGGGDSLVAAPSSNWPVRAEKTGDEKTGLAEVPVPAEALAAVRLYGELGTLASAWERAPRQALARMHMLVGRGLVPDDELGRPRQVGQRDPDDPLGLGAPPSPVEARVRLDGLVGLLVGRTSAPAVVVAAIVHAELLALRPFGSFDGVVARAGGRLVLITRGLDPKAVTSTDVGHVEAGTPADRATADRTPSDRATASAATTGAATARVATARAATAGGRRPAESSPTGTSGPGASDTPVADYAAAIQAYTTGGATGVSAWIGHYARAVELGARESLAICEALDRTG